MVNAIGTNSGSARIQILRHYTMNKLSIWKTKWRVVTPTINEKVGTKV